LLVGVFVLASAGLLGCGGGDDQGNIASSTTVQNETTAQSETSQTDSSQDGAQVETEISGIPVEFPSDAPVHPGVVTAYEATKVTESTTVHQLTVRTTASCA
jgi:hypothetical protein